MMLIYVCNVNGIPRQRGDGVGRNRLAFRSSLVFYSFSLPSVVRGGEVASFILILCAGAFCLNQIHVQLEKGNEGVPFQ